MLASVAGIACFVAGESFAQAGTARENVVLPEVARSFGVATSWMPADRKLSLAYGDHDVEIVIGTDYLMFDGKPLELLAPVVVLDGAVSMSLPDATTLFSRLLGRDINPAEILSASSASRQHSDIVGHDLIKSIRYISYPDLTRLIINIAAIRGSDAIEVNCVRSGGTLRVTFPGFRMLQSVAPFDIGDAIVRSVEPVQDGTDATLVIRTVAEGGECEVQKHDDPLRVVLDIRPTDSLAKRTPLTRSVSTSRSSEWTEPVPILPDQRISFTTVVIDAGHGGKDVGARGRDGLLEKDVTLDIALKLKELLERGTNVKVVLTRTDDQFVSLKERTAIANRAKNGSPADLFISIHTNSHASTAVTGFEAYYISDAVDPSAEATAAMENAVIAFENEGNEAVEARLTPILWDLQFTEFISESSEMAFMVQREMAERLSTQDRGVRQAQFIVLAGVAMPSVLVEVGFISNRIEETRLKTDDFRGRAAEALAAAVTDYKNRFESRLGFSNGTSNP
ncbi:MAG: hypothetical protein C4532_02465 [Candidatus Abyssobacteria bacterium SURF_17]|jgi:N-acetylmuramoyl-L-alanine amidase|uniref:N-acetylmuramoyl-L-alanine amidase n=1 Tax=Candidatus Abyssobacteria bacterium SURF_17 TaxID=2093361 RepID=A0A419F7P0_9BACT|nr:MAG: hypothetical protein C4532_02465 [Candidatus Abyssubacteria bacterium SURF_17]